MVQGCSLSEHGLRRGVVRGKGSKFGGDLVQTEGEEGLFKELGITYRGPEERELPLTG